MRITERTFQVIFDGLLVLVTIALAIIGAKQADMARKSARRAREAVELSRAATTQTKKALQVTQRAYVTLGRSDGTLMEWQSLHSGKLGAVAIYFQNTGNTAASNFYVQAELVLPEDSAEVPPCKYWGGGARDIFTVHVHSGVPKGEILIRGTLAARSLDKVRVTTKNPLSAASAKCIRDGRSNVSIYGVFEYDDMFGGYCCQNFAAAYLPDYGFLSLPPFRDNCPKLPRSTCDHNGPQASATDLHQ
jgi:hypothetical protein